MKNILVPIDFSNASENAAIYAISLAEDVDAMVTLVNVAALPLMTDDSVLASVMVTQAEIIDRDKELMQKEIDMLSKPGSSNLKGIVREGYPVEIIGEVAKETDADLIVMGMKGKGKSNSVFGSTTTAVVRRLSYPVLVVPEMATYEPIHTITFATDFDPETAPECYHILMNLSKKFNSFIQILNVQKDEMKMSDGEFIGKMRTHFSMTDSKHSFKTIENRSVIEGINDFIEKNPSDLLAMMARKHSLFERMLGRVHTRTMSYETKIPLLILQSK
jgi:nucleotide-binding universal stress UspA family protein